MEQQKSTYSVSKSFVAAGEEVTEGEVLKCYMDIFTSVSINLCHKGPKIWHHLTGVDCMLYASCKPMIILGFMDNYCS